IPALVSQGLTLFFNTFKLLPSGFYGLHHIILTLCFMALCRIKNPEQLKKQPPGELGKLLGLDRIPEVSYFRKKVHQILVQAKSDELHTALLQSYVGQMPEMFFYIDGHVLVYHGEIANLPKRFVSREKLCLSGTTEFWVNDQTGLPLMVITAELNEKLKSAIEEAIPKLLKAIPHPPEPGEPVFTLVFDREAYEPAWFKKLWDKYSVAIISYRKNVTDRWDETLFHDVEAQVFNTNATMQLCEMGTQINGIWFREVRKLSQDGHQTSIIATHPTLNLQTIAVKMFSRWTQENFFKYMIADFDFDKMVEYGTESVNQALTIPNPEYKKLTYALKKAKEKKARLEARMFKKMDESDVTNHEQLMKSLSKATALIEQISEYKEIIKDLTIKRTHVPSRIRIDQMPLEQRYNKLKQEGKKLKNAVIMLTYRAESALFNLLAESYKDTDKDGRMLLKEIFTSDADMVPDYQNNTLTIRLHSLSTPRANQAAKQLCASLNQMETCFPYTNLLLIYETVAV
ncbi:MAG: hypothetical protein HXX20_24595, partial [Chloroflexi bacterium]|nr:hypothetical protein [Chloroflexota bacterium]